MGALRIPSSLIDGTLIGCYQGARMGRSQDHGITAKEVSKSLVYVNLTEGLVKAGACGFVVAGPTGAAVALTQEGVRSAADVFMLVKGGSANALGTSVHEALTNRIEAGGGAWRGGAKGLVTGAVSCTKAGAKTGFSEGRGAVAGTCEAAAEIKNEFSLAKPLRGHVLARAARAAAGAVSGLLAAPAGLLLGLIQSSSSSEARAELSVSKQRLVSVGASTAMGAAVGALGGPLGIALGGVAGGMVGLLGAGSASNFQESVSQSLTRAQEDDLDMGTDVANKYRDIVQGSGVGAWAGFRLGWDLAQSD